jgi:hypothetical protein
MSELAPESLMAAGYGLFLALCALGLDALARLSNRRSERYRTAGFTYMESVDAWECPEGERLHRVETDLDMRLVRYRARARVCNSCRLKDACTDSDNGREIARALDSWPHSEAGRFHRGIALAMVGFSLLVICAGVGLNHGAADIAVLGAALLASALVGLYLLADLRSTPSGFPWREGEQSGNAPASNAPASDELSRSSRSSRPAVPG